MSSDSEARRQEPIATYVYDSAGRLTKVYEIHECGQLIIKRIEPFEPPAPAFRFEHDKAKGLYILRFDERTEYFRDKPARQLMVEPDPLTGEMWPVTRNGQPVYHYLCREEREAR